MIEIIAIDTNIIIRAFNGDQICSSIINSRVSIVSIITEIELLSWPQLTPDNYKLLSEFLQECFVVNLDDEVKKEVIELRKKFALKIPDAIIAATAISKDIVLFSADDIFKRVPYLKFVHVV